MKVVTASAVKNRLGDLFDVLERNQAASVLIERNGRPVAMLLNAQIAEKIVLAAYAHGVIPRSVVMEQLGLDWYGDLLNRMNALAIPRPVVSPEDEARMQAAVQKVFDAVRPDTGSRPHELKS